MEGRQLGSYRIASLLGSGGMGDVYRAYDEKLRRDVAIKVLRAADGDDDAARALLLREARAAAAVNHPNICTIHEVGEHDGLAFLAMELVDGEPLHRIIPSGTGLPIDRMVDFVQVADALAHAHERGVHRDRRRRTSLSPRGRAKCSTSDWRNVVTSLTTTGGQRLYRGGRDRRHAGLHVPERCAGVGRAQRRGRWASCC